MELCWQFVSLLLLAIINIPDPYACASLPITVPVKWVGDGSPELRTQGNLVQCTLDQLGENVYALWDDGTRVTAGFHYWKLRLTNASGPSAGLTDLRRFKKGWAYSGLMHNGNLHNGGRLLVQEFGPTIQSGDVLGIYATFELSSLKVFFDLNDSHLGLAFNVPRNLLTSLFPIVSFSSPGSVTIEKVLELIKSVERPVPRFKWILGDWKLVEKDFKINSVVQTGIEGDATLRLLKKEKAGFEAYEAQLTVVNYIWFSQERKGPEEPWISSEKMSTRINGSEVMMRLEGNIVGLITNPTLVELSGFKTLVIRSSAFGLESSWERYSIEHVTVTHRFGPDGRYVVT